MAVLLLEQYSSCTCNVVEPARSRRCGGISTANWKKVLAMSDSVKLATSAELDPVCGMTVNPATARGSVEHAGKTYYFCSNHCVSKFQQDPEKYLHQVTASHASGLVTLGTQKADVPPAPSAKVKDPVCGMEVDPATAKQHAQHAGKTYYFCCGGCLEKFRSEPVRFLEPKASPGLVQLGGSALTPPGPANPAHMPDEEAQNQRTYVCPMCPEVRKVGPGPCPSCGMALEAESPVPVSKIEYTCPMHPEIVRSEPGSCPICGMALEPRTVTAHEEENPELHDMSRRFWVSLVLTAPLLIIAMLDMLPGMPVEHALPAGWLPWIELILATPVVLWGGWPFFQRGWTSIVNRSTNMFTLIAMGTGVAYLYSLIATVWPQIFPPAFRGMNGRPEIYF